MKNLEIILIFVGVAIATISATYSSASWMPLAVLLGALIAGFSGDIARSIRKEIK